MLSACSSSGPRAQRACRGRWSRCCRSRARCRPWRSGSARRACAAARAATPRCRRRRCARSTCRTRSRSGRSRMRHSCVGTSAHVVAPCCCAELAGGSPPRHLPGGGYTIVMFVSVGGDELAVEPRDVEHRRRRDRSPGARPAARSATAVLDVGHHRTAPLSIDASRKWMLLRCDSITPLGRPVVPLVNRMTNGSSSSMATSGNCGVGCVRLERREVVARTRPPGAPSGSSMPSRRSSASPVAEQHLRLGELDRVRDLLTRPPAVEPDRDRAERGRRPERRSAYSTVFGATMATRSPGPMP